MDNIVDDDSFDIALGASETLLRFADSFSDSPTKAFVEWPDWMIKDPETGEWLLFTARFAFVSFVKAFSLWKKRFPKAVVKFNLEGITQGINDLNVPIRGITLRELQYILEQDVTVKFFLYNESGLTKLTDDELQDRLEQAKQLFTRLY